MWCIWERLRARMFLNDIPIHSPEVTYQICSPHCINCSGSIGTETDYWPDDWVSSLEGNGCLSAPINPRRALRFLHSSLWIVKQPEREAEHRIFCFNSNWSLKLRCNNVSAMIEFLLFEEFTIQRDVSANMAIFKCCTIYTGITWKDIRNFLDFRLPPCTEYSRSSLE